MAHIWSEGFDWANTSTELNTRLDSGSAPTTVTDTQFSYGRAVSGTAVKTLPGNYGEIFGSWRCRGISGTAWPRLALMDGTTSQVVFERSMDGRFYVQRGGTVLTSVLDDGNFQTWASYQFRVVIHNTAGIIQVRKNGSTTNLIDLTGANTRASANSYANKLQLYNNNGAYHDDIWLNDTTGTLNNSWPGDVRIITQFPSGAGTSTQFTPSTGSNWQCVDEAPLNGDTDYVSSSTVGHKDLYTVAALGVTPTSIKCVSPFALVKKADAGAREVGVRHLSGATEQTVASHSGLTSSTYQYVGGALETDPNTSAAWTLANVNAQQVGPVIVA